MGLETEVPAEEETSEAVGTQNDARLARAAEIADQVDQARASELSEVPEEASPAAAPKSETSSPIPPSVPEPRRYKLKVHGREIELTEEELVSRAQKVEAADQYLIEAAKLYKDARAPSGTPAVSNGSAATESTEELASSELALARALQVGTEEEAAKAIKLIEQRALAAFQKQAQPPDQVFSAMFDMRRAHEKFESENDDVLKDPVLKSLVVATDARLKAQEVEQGIERPFFERWTEAAKFVRQWKTTIAPAAATFAEKEARKSATVVSIPTASAKAPAAPPDPDEDDAPSAVIARMARLRPGQANI